VFSDPQRLGGKGSLARKKRGGKIEKERESKQRGVGKKRVPLVGYQSSLECRKGKVGSREAEREKGAETQSEGFTTKPSVVATGGGKKGFKGAEGGGPGRGCIPTRVTSSNHQPAKS